jgi:hypothetical protein
MRASRVKWAAAVATVVGLFAGLATPAGAGSLPVSGSWAGPGNFYNQECDYPERPPGTSPIGAGTADASGDLGSIGATQVNTIVCLDVRPGSDRAFGPLTLTTADGTITATMEGHAVRDTPPPIGGPYPFDLVATVTGGTGRFVGTTGTLNVHAVVLLSPAFTVSGTLDGSVTVPPHTPASKDDCKNGGWQSFEDENGQPFPNQGQCVAWVNHHA